MTSIDFSSLSPELTSGIFSISAKDSNALGLSLDKSSAFQKNAEDLGKPDYLLIHGIHEGFHSNPSDKVLREARGLYDLYQQKFSKEAKTIASTDQLEGTAFYAELVGGAITKLGCAAGDKDLIADAAKELRTKSDISGTSDSESYPLGAAAVLIMRMTGDYAGWEQKISQGTTPLAILMEKIVPATFPDDPDLRREADHIVKQENQRYEPSVRTFLDSMKDPTAVAIHLKTQNTLGSYRTEGFIRHRGTGKKLTLSYEGAIASSGRTDLYVKISGLTLESLDDSSECGSSGLVTYVPRKHLRFHNKTVSIHAPSITVKDIPVKSSKDQTGREWICIM